MTPQQLHSNTWSTDSPQHRLDIAPTVTNETDSQDQKLQTMFGSERKQDCPGRGATAHSRRHAPLNKRKKGTARGKFAITILACCRRGHICCAGLLTCRRRRLRKEGTYPRYAGQTPEPAGPTDGEAAQLAPCVCHAVPDLQN
uniref:Uncharacterized protein n=1 Tax=Branchiostoma floridae TaxID=7739 RepID=C3ZE37_BRAFL|eukprot:XP_002592982.1 hypothetical protein BRAFLDRAFT_65566 [Branchiostoma floridae]